MKIDRIEPLKYFHTEKRNCFRLNIKPEDCYSTNHVLERGEEDVIIITETSKIIEKLNEVIEYINKQD